MASGVRRRLLRGMEACASTRRGSAPRTSVVASWVWTGFSRRSRTGAGFRRSSWTRCKSRSRPLGAPSSIAERVRIISLMGSVLSHKRSTPAIGLELTEHPHPAESAAPSRGCRRGPRSPRFPSRPRPALMSRGIAAAVPTPRESCGAFFPSPKLMLAGIAFLIKVRRPGMRQRSRWASAPRLHFLDETSISRRSARMGVRRLLWFSQVSRPDSHAATACESRPRREGSPCESLAHDGRDAAACPASCWAV